MNTATHGKEFWATAETEWAAEPVTLAEIPISMAELVFEETENRTQGESTCSH